jgi:hypothetical protein
MKNIKRASFAGALCWYADLKLPYGYGRTHNYEILAQTT